MDRFVLNARNVRSDFCFIVLVLSLGDVMWYLLPPAAIGAGLLVSSVYPQFPPLASIDRN